MHEKSLRSGSSRAVMWVQLIRLQCGIPGFDPLVGKDLEKGKATDSSILA